MATHQIQLSQFPFRFGVRLSVKRSKGLEKTIRIGAISYTSDKLAIVCKPLENLPMKFKLNRLRNGTLQLLQAQDGELSFRICEDITLLGNSEATSENYIKVANNKGTWYIALERNEVN